MCIFIFVFSDWSDYPSSLRGWTKYCTQREKGNYNQMDGLTSLQPMDDAAKVNWGSTWRMPTREEIEELVSSCICHRVIGDSYVFKLTGPNGNSIYFLGDNDVFYWSKSLNSTNSDEAFALGNVGEEGDHLGVVSHGRKDGAYIRAVVNE